MGCVYVLRHGNENLFKIGRTQGSVQRVIEQLSRGNPYRLTEFDRIETEDAAACEAHLHQALRSKRVVRGGGTEFFEVEPLELKAVLRKAEEYVTEFLAVIKQAEALNGTEMDSSAPPVKPTPREVSIYSRLLTIREEQDRLSVQRKYCESKLKLTIGTSCALEGIATWKGSWRQQFDVPAFRAADPQLFAELYRTYGSEAYKRTFLLQRLP